MPVRWPANVPPDFFLELIFPFVLSSLHHASPTGPGHSPGGAIGLWARSHAPQTPPWKAGCSSERNYSCFCADADVSKPTVLLIIEKCSTYNYSAGLYHLGLCQLTLRCWPEDKPPKNAFLDAYPL